MLQWLHQFDVKGGKLFGSIQIDGDVYQLYALDGDKSILAKKGYTNPQWICGNNLPGDASSLLPPRGAVVSPCNNNCVIRVLALFTANAAAAVPDIENTVEMTVAQTNQAFRSSLIDECDAELVLVDVQQIPFGETPADVVGDRDNLIADMQDPMGGLNINEMRDKLSGSSRRQ